MRLSSFAALQLVLAAGSIRISITSAFFIQHSTRTPRPRGAGRIDTTSLCIRNSETKLASSYTKLLYNNDDPQLQLQVDFQELDQRLEALERTLPSSLLGFYEPLLKSFAVRPGSERFSVTSTLFALDCFQYDAFSSITDVNMAISSKSLGSGSNNNNNDNDNDNNNSMSNTKVKLREVLDATLDSNWSEEDLFQVPLLVHTVLALDKKRVLFRDMDNGRKERVRVLMESLLDARPMRRNGHTQPLSDYLIFLCAQAMATMHDSTKTFDNDDDISNAGTNAEGVRVGGLPLDALPPDFSSQLTLGVVRSAETSFNELCRQLAYRNAGDGNNFDVMRLGYSLLTYVVTTNTLVGTAGMELVQGGGPIDTVGPANSFLIKQGLKAFFLEQNDDGLWDKGQPIFKSFRRTGRNVGNAFVFATDTVASLLK